MNNKNTRVIYIDDINLKAYDSLEDKDFKEFFMTMFTYRTEREGEYTISNPMLQILFDVKYKPLIDHNEEKYEKRAQSNRLNGLKGGRPTTARIASELHNYSSVDKSTSEGEKASQNANMEAVEVLNDRTRDAAEELTKYFNETHCTLDSSVESFRNGNARVIDRIEDYYGLNDSEFKEVYDLALSRLAA